MYPFLEEKLCQEERAKAVNDFFSPRYAQEGFDSVVYINVLDTSKMIALSWLMHERC